jgi:hypothetical protein
VNVAIGIAALISVAGFLYLAWLDHRRVQRFSDIRENRWREGDTSLDVLRSDMEALNGDGLKVRRDFTRALDRELRHQEIQEHEWVAMLRARFLGRPSKRRVGGP